MYTTIGNQLNNRYFLALKEEGRRYCLFSFPSVASPHVVSIPDRKKIYTTHSYVIVISC